MYIFVIAQYPQESANELGKRFLEAKPVPDFMTLSGPFIKSGIEGTRTIAIFDFDASRYVEVMDFLNNRYAAYHGIPGFRYSIEEWLEAGNALKLIGLG